MQRIARVSHNFNKMNPLKQVFLGGNVIRQLTDHPDVFGSGLPFSLADLTAANNNLKNTYTDFKNSGTSKREMFIAARTVWLNRFRATASAVNTIANGSAEVIALSEFALSKTETAPSAEPPVPQAADINYGRTKGTLKAQVKRVPDAVGYVFTAASSGVTVERNNNQITVKKAGDAVVTIVVGTQKNIEFTGLPSKTDLKIGVAAFNRAGMGGFTPPVETGMP